MIAQIERKIHVPDFRDGIRSGVNALGGLRAVESVAVRPIMPGSWPELRLTIYGQLVRLVIRPRLRELNATVQPLYTDAMPGILITINPGRAGSLPPKIWAKRCCHPMENSEIGKSLY